MQGEDEDEDDEEPQDSARAGAAATSESAAASSSQASAKKSKGRKKSGSMLQEDLFGLDEDLQITVRCCSGRIGPRPDAHGAGLAEAPWAVRGGPQETDEEAAEELDRVRVPRRAHGLASALG